MGLTVYQLYWAERSTLPFAVWVLTEAGQAAVAARSQKESPGPGVPWPGEYVEEVWLPDWASPPGSTVKDLCDEKGWSDEDLAVELGWSTAAVTALTSGDDFEITTLIALELAEVFGGPEEFWLNRERQYREALARGAVKV